MDSYQAICAGQVVSEGSSVVTRQGFCWNFTGEPTLEDEVLEATPGWALYSMAIQDLECSRSYHVRAFAVNASGVAFGEERTFDTGDCVPEWARFVVTDDQGVWRFDSDGSLLKLDDADDRDLGVYDGLVYIKWGRDIRVVDLDGNPVRQFTLDSRIRYPWALVMLPLGHMALLDNENDSISITDENGTLLHALPMSDSPPDDNLQSVHGIVVDNALIVSKQGNDQWISIDLDTYVRTDFYKVPEAIGRPGDLDFQDGTFISPPGILCIPSGRKRRLLICELPEGNNIDLTVLGNFAYISSNFGNQDLPGQPSQWSV
ncbi:MAG: hypothetical protein R2751_08740 [Bacteroidales bacterium]